MHNDAFGDSSSDILMGNAQEQHSAVCTDEGLSLREHFF